ncbi:Uncharacterized conserved protein, DUF305 family [Saccharopolyspora kobensis]|uniref:Uncharacterized conserved protein, DUF305 family n=1 Tax=Saccharopolyspora kobensis TaxID=146035 RepID=A0A1H6C6B6_9PSEU|nr:DUF305 domain-containing protein [Saccharopolyspora kobensis]SEG68511.1 Uncharacterized conserved protein, DUF305 family [Saccharopolyspora kobensis]SFC30176.1 Uncharacterized conserved protein, DUF305 family [Saccharopolyspora kobensis]
MRRLTAALLIAVAGLAGCAGEQPEPPKVVLPGAPGDQPQVVASAAPDAGVPVDVEADYLRMMIAHHEQALEMTALAPERAQHPKVRALAERIGGAQGPEIGAMQGWLDTRGFGEEHSGHGHPTGHDHATMPGMATPEQLAQLRDSTGADFDRLFLQLMIAHHEGALTMATDVLTRGREEQVHAMATDVLVTQQSEIDTMRGLQGEVG